MKKIAVLLVSLAILMVGIFNAYAESENSPGQAHRDRVAL